MKKLILLVWAVLLLTTACQSSSPDEVVLAQMEPWNNGDIEAAMDLYTDDAYIKIQPAIPPGSPDQHTGKTQLREWFKDLVAANFELDVEIVEVDGDTVTTKTKTWVDPTRELGVAPLVATEVYTVEDGKIAGWTWTLSDESLAELEAAMAAAPAEQAAPAAQATVVFDGEACSYEGPATAVAGSHIEFDFQATAKADDIALVVSPVKEGTTWEQTLDHAATAKASLPAPFAASGWEVLYGPGSMTVSLQDLDYAVLCATSPSDTNENYAAGFIEVTET